MRIALAQIDAAVGDLRGNAERILSALDEAARRGAALAVFPEQTLGGYPALDLWEERGFAEANEKALAALARKVRGTAALVGFVSRSADRVGKPVRNSAALLRDGKVVAVRHKTLLPTYDVFDEARYFEPARGNAPISFGGLKLGVTICEDAWAKDPSSSRRLYSVDPVAAQAKAGADVLLNLSASPFLRGKTAVRRKLLGEHARRLRLPFFYCNAVGGNDEIVFDGGSLAYDGKGRLRARAAFAAQDLLVIDTRTWEGARLAPEPDSVGQVGEALTLGIKDFASKCGLQTAFIGLSGGIDSAVVAALAVRALGPHRVVGVSMPSAYSSRGSVVADSGNNTIRSQSIPPAIITQPQSQTNVTGSIATFSVGVSGSSPFNYTWQFNGSNYPTGSSSSLMSSNAGTYMVIVSNAVGQATSSPATLTLTNPPGVPGVFQSIAVQGNGSVKFGLGGSSGYNYTLIVSTNLRTWSNLVTFIMTNGAIQYIDTTTTNIPARFYRLVNP